MSTIVTRAGKGSALTHNEVDANFNNLNNDKIEATQSVTLTNKTISGSSNTLTNIGNASLTNSSVTIGSTSVSLGSTATTVSGLTLSSPTVSGGTINNASIGATTPSTGAFTTLSASSTVSGTGFSDYLASPPAIGGTAPAAITGTTITANTVFSGALNGTVGATTPNTGAFTTLSATGVTTVQAGSASAPAITTSGDTNTGIFFPAADTAAISTGGSERMRIDSAGNVGIGTTSPSAKLSVVSGTEGIELAPADTTNQGRILFYDRTNSEFNTGAYDALAHIFRTSGAEKMRLDNAGNLGLGVTPSAWYVGAGTSKAIQFGESSSIYDFSASGNRQTHIINNAYLNTSGNYIYQSSDYASRYMQQTGAHRWYTAPSGTAGNAITFTQVLSVSGGNSLALEGATSQAGTGITFPATQSASTNANTLDDYEEGTFTPTVAGSTTAGTGTYSNQLGRYTKIGNRVYYTIYLVWTAHTGTGNLRVASLPFTSANVTNKFDVASIYPSNVTMTASNYMVGYVGPNNTVIIFDQTPVGGGTSNSVAMDTAGSLLISGHYEV